MASFLRLPAFPLPARPNLLSLALVSSADPDAFLAQLPWHVPVLVGLGEITDYGEGRGKGASIMPLHPLAALVRGGVTPAHFSKALAGAHAALGDRLDVHVLPGIGSSGEVKSVKLTDWVEAGVLIETCTGGTPDMLEALLEVLEKRQAMTRPVMGSLGQAGIDPWRGLAKNPTASPADFSRMLRALDEHVRREMPVASQSTDPRRRWRSHERMMRERRHTHALVQACEMGNERLVEALQSLGHAQLRVSALAGAISAGAALLALRTLAFGPPAEWVSDPHLAGDRSKDLSTLRGLARCIAEASCKWRAPNLPEQLQSLAPGQCQALAQLVQEMVGGGMGDLSWLRDDPDAGHSLATALAPALWHCPQATVAQAQALMGPGDLSDLAIWHHLFHAPEGPWKQAMHAWMDEHLRRPATKLAEHLSQGLGAQLANLAKKEWGAADVLVVDLALLIEDQLGMKSGEVLEPALGTAGLDETRRARYREMALDRRLIAAPGRGPGPRL